MDVRGLNLSEVGYVDVRTVCDSCIESSCASVPIPATARMFPSLAAHRPWHVFRRVSLQQRSSLSQRPPRFPQLYHGEQTFTLRSSVHSLKAWCLFERAWKGKLWLCCTGWQSGGLHSLWFSLPDCRVVSLGLGKVQYYSTSDTGKDGPPKPPSGDAPSAAKVVSGAAQATPESPGKKLEDFHKLHKL